MKHPRCHAFFLAVALLSAATPLAQANESPACDLSSISGSYGFSLTGSYQQTPYAISGRFASNGKGALTGTATQSVAGKTFAGNFSATYQVDPECTGNAMLTFAGGAESGLNFTIVSGGDEVLLIDTDSGTVETGSAKRQFKTHPR